MPVVTCERCGSSEVDADPSGSSSPGRLAVRCTECGHAWTRAPRPSCPRCGSGDLDETGYEGWAFDDDDEQARDAPSSAPWSYVDRAVFRCRSCRNQWSTVDAVRPYRPDGA